MPSVDRICCREARACAGQIRGSRRRMQILVAAPSGPTRGAGVRFNGGEAVTGAHRSARRTRSKWRPWDARLGDSDHTNVRMAEACWGKKKTLTSGTPHGGGKRWYTRGQGVW
jgi:hypothetical protein